MDKLYGSVMAWFGAAFTSFALGVLQNTFNPAIDIEKTIGGVICGFLIITGLPFMGILLCWAGVNTIRGKE